MSQSIYDNPILNYYARTPMARGASLSGDLQSIKPLEVAKSYNTKLDRKIDVRYAVPTTNQLKPIESKIELGQIMQPAFKIDNIPDPVPRSNVEVKIDNQYYQVNDLLQPSKFAETYLKKQQEGNRNFLDNDIVASLKESYDDKESVNGKLLGRDDGYLMVKDSEGKENLLLGQNKKLQKFEADLMPSSFGDIKNYIQHKQALGQYAGADINIYSKDSGEINSIGEIQDIKGTYQKANTISMLGDYKGFGSFDNVDFAKTLVARSNNGTDIALKTRDDLNLKNDLFGRTYSANSPLDVASQFLGNTAEIASRGYDVAKSSFTNYTAIASDNYQEIAKAFETKDFSNVFQNMASNVMQVSDKTQSESSIRAMKENQLAIKRFLTPITLATGLKGSDELSLDKKIYNLELFNTKDYNKDVNFDDLKFKNAGIVGQIDPNVKLASDVTEFLAIEALTGAGLIKGSVGFVKGGVSAGIGLANSSLKLTTAIPKAYGAVTGLVANVNNFDDSLKLLAESGKQLASKMPSLKNVIKNVATDIPAVGVNLLNTTKSAISGSLAATKLSDIDRNLVEANIPGGGIYTQSAKFVLSSLATIAGGTGDVLMENNQDNDNVVSKGLWAFGASLSQSSYSNIVNNLQNGLPPKIPYNGFMRKDENGKVDLNDTGGALVDSIYLTMSPIAISLLGSNLIKGIEKKMPNSTIGKGLSTSLALGAGGIYDAIGWQQTEQAKLNNDFDKVKFAMVYSYLDKLGDKAGDAFIDPIWKNAMKQNLTKLVGNESLNTVFRTSLGKALQGGQDPAFDLLIGISKETNMKWVERYRNTLGTRAGAQAFAVQFAKGAFSEGIAESTQSIMENQGTSQGNNPFDGMSPIINAGAQGLILGAAMGGIIKGVSDFAGVGIKMADFEDTIGGGIEAVKNFKFNADIIQKSLDETVNKFIPDPKKMTAFGAGVIGAIKGGIVEITNPFWGKVNKNINDKSKAISKFDAIEDFTATGKGDAHLATIPINNPDGTTDIAAIVIAPNSSNQVSQFTDPITQKVVTGLLIDNGNDRAIIELEVNKEKVKEGIQFDKIKQEGGILSLAYLDSTGNIIDLNEGANIKKGSMNGNGKFTASDEISTTPVDKRPRPITKSAVTKPTTQPVTPKPSETSTPQETSIQQVTEPVTTLSKQPKTRNNKTPYVQTTPPTNPKNNTNSSSSKRSDKPKDTKGEKTGETRKDKRKNRQGSKTPKDNTRKNDNGTTKGIARETEPNQQINGGKQDSILTEAANSNQEYNEDNKQQELTSGIDKVGVEQIETFINGLPVNVDSLIEQVDKANDVFKNIDTIGDKLISETDQGKKTQATKLYNKMVARIGEIFKNTPNETFLDKLNINKDKVIEEVEFQYNNIIEYLDEDHPWQQKTRYLSNTNKARLIRVYKDNRGFDNIKNLDKKVRGIPLTNPDENIDVIAEQLGENYEDYINLQNKVINIRQEFLEYSIALNEKQSTDNEFLQTIYEGTEWTPPDYNKGIQSINLTPPPLQSSGAMFAFMSSMMQVPVVDFVMQNMVSGIALSKALGVFLFSSESITRRDIYIPNIETTEGQAMRITEAAVVVQAIIAPHQRVTGEILDRALKQEKSGLISSLLRRLKLNKFKDWYEGIGELVMYMGSGENDEALPIEEFGSTWNRDFNAKTGIYDFTPNQYSSATNTDQQIALTELLVKNNGYVRITMPVGELVIAKLKNGEVGAVKFDVKPDEKDNEEVLKQAFFGAIKDNVSTLLSAINNISSITLITSATPRDGDYKGTRLKNYVQDKVKKKGYSDIQIQAAKDLRTALNAFGKELAERGGIIGFNNTFTPFGYEATRELDRLDDVTQTINTFGGYNLTTTEQRFNKNMGIANLNIAINLNNTFSKNQQRLKMSNLLSQLELAGLIKKSQAVQVERTRYKDLQQQFTNLLINNNAPITGNQLTFDNDVLKEDAMNEIQNELNRLNKLYQINSEIPPTKDITFNSTFEVQGQIFFIPANVHNSLYLGDELPTPVANTSLISDKKDIFTALGDMVLSGTKMIAEKTKSWKNNPVIYSVDRSLGLIKSGQTMSLKNQNENPTQSVLGWALGHVTLITQIVTSGDLRKLSNLYASGIAKNYPNVTNAIRSAYDFNDYGSLIGLDKYLGEPVYPMSNKFSNFTIKNIIQSPVFNITRLPLLLLKGLDRMLGSNLITVSMYSNLTDLAKARNITLDDLEKMPIDELSKLIALAKNKTGSTLIAQGTAKNQSIVLKEMRQIPIGGQVIYSFTDWIAQQVNNHNTQVNNILESLSLKKTTKIDRLSGVQQGKVDLKRFKDSLIAIIFLIFADIAILKVAELALGKALAELSKASGTNPKDQTNVGTTNPIMVWLNDQTVGVVNAARLPPSINSVGRDFYNFAKTGLFGIENEQTKQATKQVVQDMTSIIPALGVLLPQPTFPQTAEAMIGKSVNNALGLKYVNDIFRIFNSATEKVATKEGFEGFIDNAVGVDVINFINGGNSKDKTYTVTNPETDKPMEVAKKTDLTSKLFSVLPGFDRNINVNYLQDGINRATTNKTTDLIKLNEKLDSPSDFTPDQIEKLVKDKERLLQQVKDNNLQIPSEVNTTMPDKAKLIEQAGSSADSDNIKKDIMNKSGKDIANAGSSVAAMPSSSGSGRGGGRTRKGKAKRISVKKLSSGDRVRKARSIKVRKVRARKTRVATIRKPRAIRKRKIRLT